jgi:hypothetical protein
MSNKQTVRDVNSLSNGELVKLLKPDYIDWVKGLEMLRFVISQDPEDWKDTIELLQAVVMSKINYGNGDLANIKTYADDNGVPYQWAVSVFVAKDTTNKRREPDGMHLNKAGL